MKVRQIPSELKELFEVVKPKNPISYEKQCELINKIAELSKKSSPEMIIDACEEKGNTLLMEACMNDHVEIVKALLDAKADPNGKNENGANALYCASLISHNLEIMQILIDAKADANITTEKTGETMLYYAILGKHFDVVKKLLIEGQSNTFHKDGESELDILVQRYHIDLRTGKPCELTFTNGKIQRKEVSNEQLEKMLLLVNILLSRDAPFRYALFTYQFLLACDQRQILNSLTKFCQKLENPRDDINEEKRQINKDYPYNEAPQYLKKLKTVMEYKVPSSDSIILERDNASKLTPQDVEILHKKIYQKQHPYSLWSMGAAVMGAVGVGYAVIQGRRNG